MTLGPDRAPEEFSAAMESRASRRWAEKRFDNIVHWNELERGGHFAAFEQPEVYVDEVRTCFRGLR